MRRKKKKAEDVIQGICVVCKIWANLESRNKSDAYHQRFCTVSSRWVSDEGTCPNWQLSSYLYCPVVGAGGQCFRPATSCAAMQRGKRVCYSCYIGKIVRHYTVREVIFSMSGREMILGAANELLQAGLFTTEKVQNLKTLIERKDIKEIGEYYMGLIESIPLKYERTIPKESLRIYNALIDGTISLDAPDAIHEQKITFMRTR